MPSLRLESVAQAVFPNQRNDEKIFVISRRHYVGYIVYCSIVFFLAIVPLIMVLVAFDNLAFLFQPQNLLLRDGAILFALLYYLLLSFFFIATWIMYYYNILILTD